jgi:hypothetical protein
MIVLEHVDRYTFCSGFHPNGTPNALTIFRDNQLFDRRILLLLFSYLPYSRRVTYGSTDDTLDVIVASSSRVINDTNDLIPLPANENSLDADELLNGDPSNQTPTTTTTTTTMNVSPLSSIDQTDTKRLDPPSPINVAKDDFRDDDDISELTDS